MSYNPCTFLFGRYRLEKFYRTVFLRGKMKGGKNYGRRKQKSNDRKQKVKEITDKLEEGLKELFESEKYMS